MYIANYSDSLRVPGITVTPSRRMVEYQVQTNDAATTRVIAGYEVIRFGVPMIGEYANAGPGGTVLISPAVPGAQYRITAWALNSGTRRSATPAVVYATTGEAGELHHYIIHKTLLSKSSKVGVCLHSIHELLTYNMYVTVTVQHRVPSVDQPRAVHVLVVK